MSNKYTIFYKASKRVEHGSDLLKFASFPFRLRVIDNVRHTGVFEDAEYMITYTTSEMLQHIAASKVSVPVEECPDCDNIGVITTYMAVDPAIDSGLTGSQYMTTKECRFCIDVPNSRYNVEKLAKTP